MHTFKQTIKQKTTKIPETLLTPEWKKINKTCEKDKKKKKKQKTTKIQI